MRVMIQCCLLFTWLHTLNSADSADVEPFLIFASGKSLKKMNLDGSNVSTLKQDLQDKSPWALDFDYRQQMIYWTDVDSEMISRMHINGSGIQVLHRKSVDSPGGLAVDWVGGNLYWSDWGRDTIEVSKLTGEHRAVLVNTGLDEPYALAVDVRYGYLYWSDWGNNPHIGRIGMDGTNRSIIVKDKITRPTGLTLDFNNERIYWTDAREHSIEFANLDGTNRHTVLNQGIRYISAITLFEDHIYWRVYDTRSIYRAHKTQGTGKTLLFSSPDNLRDIRVYHPYRQPEVPGHPCQSNNGGCSNLCLLSPGAGYKCPCPTNSSLAADNKQCMSSCTASQFACRNYKCVPLSLKCDMNDDCGDRSDEPTDCSFTSTEALVPVLSRHPDWPDIFVGEAFILKCTIQGSASDWMFTFYEHRLAHWDVMFSSADPEYVLFSSNQNPSGEYRCGAQLKHYQQLSKDSNTITVSFKGKPKATLKAEQTVIPAGGSVTLTCSVEVSSGWKYWYLNNQSLIVRNDAGPIRVSVGGVYRCRAGRGDPVYYTEYSDALTLNTADGLSTVEPDPDTDTVTQPQPATHSHPTATLFSECGISHVKPRRGKESRPGVLPWQASLQIRTTGSDEPFEHTCGGVLVASCWVLTAAHCIEDYTDMQVVLGAVDISRHEDMNIQVIRVERAIPHKEYRSTPHGTAHNDVALLQLKVTDSPFCAKESLYVKIACLPNKRFPDGMVCVTSGWGRTENLNNPDKLSYGRIPLMSKQQCVAKYVGLLDTGLLDDTMICAGDLVKRVDTCQDDSGGPLMCSENGVNYIAGLVSWRKAECGGRQILPGFYADVHRYVDWINQIAGLERKCQLPAQFSQCGRLDPFITRVAGGRESRPGLHPWQASLQTRTTGRTTEPFVHTCGGVLIASCWVLTAAHCIFPKDMQVVLGGVNISAHEEYDQVIPVERAIVHKDYGETDRGTAHNDIALLQLKVTDCPFCAKETRYVRTACLPNQHFPDGKVCTISGWGSTDHGSKPDKLLYGRIPLMSKQRCVEKFASDSHLLDDTMICAGDLAKGVDTCEGDSGGPLTCNENGVHYITGVVSWGNTECGGGHGTLPGIYADVLRYVDWINQIIS